MANRRRAASRLARSFSSALAAASVLESNSRPRLDWRGLGLILSFCVSFHLAGIAVPRAPAATLVVDPQSGPYYTIQSAISMAAAYDTIEVHPGLYPEQLRPLLPVTIRGRGGADSTFVSGGGFQRVLELENVAVVVHGLTFENGRGEAIGGAILCTNGTFDAAQCVFRGSRASNTDYEMAHGGAIAFVGESRSSLVDCLFIHNEADNPRASHGGAIDINGAWGKTPESAGPPPGKNLLNRYMFLNCSFLSNRARATAAIWSNELVEVRNCVFVDKGSALGAFVNAPESSILACNIYQDLPSPQVEDRAGKTMNGEPVDPRICPDDEAAVHESSPLWNNWSGCGRIGSLPVGCAGPMVLSTNPRVLRPAANQQLHMYGYGLEEVLDARLEGPHGERVPSKLMTIEGPWVTVTFDLVEQSSGQWTLILRTATAGEIRAAEVDLSSIEIWGFFDGWVPAPSLYEGRIAGRDLSDGLQLRLEHAGDGLPSEPIEILEALGTDSLRVRVDLRGAPEGAYDLIAEAWGGEVLAIRPALYLGTPPVVRVPEDAPTIAWALANSDSFSEILVATGSYEGRFIIDRPLRLRGSRTADHRAWLKPHVAGYPVVHVLPQAGPLAEIEGFLITDGRTEGPGAGIRCEAPALIRDNEVWGNAATGAGARGAGIFAVSGTRIIGNRIVYNRITDSTPNEDIWSTDPAAGGVAGGLFCLNCWVEGNRIEGNSAPEAGGLLAEGVVRENVLVSNYADYSSYGTGAIRGEITDNRFDECCSAFEPHLFIEGPARVERNLFTFIGGLMCSMYDSVYLSGSMDLVGNLFANMGIYACLRTDPAREFRAGHFRMEHNVFVGDNPGIDLRYDADQGACPSQGPSGPFTTIAMDSTYISCNIGNPDRLAIHRHGQVDRCETCIYEFEDLPPSCPDTIPNFEFACDEVPVLLEAAGLGVVPGGIRLYWTIPLDVNVLGFDVDREVGGQTERLTVERLTGCRTCEYIDRAPVEGRTSNYTLRIYGGNAEPASILLGTWDGEAFTGFDLSLEAPRPHPVAGRAVLRLSVPGGGSAIRLELFDMGGRIVSVVKEGVFPTGTHAIVWDPRDDRGVPLASGVYLLRLSAGGRSVNRKVLVLH
jgi:hypothetical protein